MPQKPYFYGGRMAYEMPFFERYIKEQSEAADGVENVIYGGKRVGNYEEYKKYYELNERLLKDLIDGKHLGLWNFIPDFHVAAANQSVISHAIKVTKITSDTKHEFWLRAYLALHLYSDFYELLWKEYKQLCKKLPTATEKESPFTTIRKEYPYSVPLFDYCVNKYRTAVSHAMYLITDKQLFIYPTDRKTAEEIKSDDLTNHFNNEFLLYNALFVSRLRLENSYFAYVSREKAKTNQRFVEETERIFREYYERPAFKSPEDFLETYGKLLEENIPKP